MSDIKRAPIQIVATPLYPGQTYLERKGDLTSTPVAIVYANEYLHRFVAADDMFIALETIIATANLTTGEKVLCATALAKAMGVSIEEVIASQSI